MMLNIKINDTALDFLNYSPLSFFLSFFFLLELLMPLLQFNENSSLFFSHENDYTCTKWLTEMDNISNIQAIGQLLYTIYFPFFLIAGFILFIAILGSLMLTVVK